MKFWFAALMSLAMVVSGCASKKPASTKPVPVKKTPATPVPKPDVSEKKSEAKKPVAESKFIVTPENLLVGTVATYNTAGRFVVLDFPLAKMPILDQVMFIYRQGLKVGEVKITGPERDHNTVADLISGEARKGDEVRDK